MALCRQIVDRLTKKGRKDITRNIRRLIAILLTTLTCVSCNTMHANEPGPLYTTVDIKNKVSRIKKGISIAECKAALGEPTLEQKSFAKRGSALIGTSFYYVVRKQGAKLDPKRDIFLEVLFNRNGRLVDVVEYNL